MFETGELHRVRALDEDLVFVAFLHKVEAVPTREETGVSENDTNEKDAVTKDTYLTWHM